MKKADSKKTLVWGQLKILLALRRAGGQPLSLEELSGSQIMDPSHLRKLVDGLAAQGLITFESESDGSVVGVRLTEKGASVAEEQKADLEQMFGRIKSRFADLVVPIRIPALGLSDEFARRIVDISETLSRTLREVVLRPSQAIREVLREASEFTQALSEDGYEWRWLGSASLPLHRELLRITREKGTAAAERALIGMVAEQSFLDDLGARAREVECVRPSADVIRDALKAHAEKRYALSIPALMPQLEASIRRLYREKCNVSDRKAGIDPNTGKGADDMPTVLKALRKPGNILFEFFIAHLTKNFFSKSRNPVLHGRRPDYATPELSTECVVALNELCNRSDWT